MGLCRMSREGIKNGCITLDNKFVTDYMPAADEIRLKVYLFGLLSCADPDSPDNTTYHFCNALSITPEQLKEAFEYWSSEGLVTIVSDSPLEVRYNLVKGLEDKLHYYKKGKYEEFNAQLQGLFPERMLNSNDYEKYYVFLETTHMPQEVMLMIAGYCVNYRKATKISDNYVLAVAQAWHEEGIRTVQDAEDMISRHESSTEAMRLIFKALGKKSEADLDDKQFYIKWTKSWGFDLSGILFAAKQCKKRGGMERLDKILDEYFTHNCLAVTDMQAYSDERQSMYDLAKEVTRIIGVRYENLETVVSHYICVWLSQGFDKDALILVAEYCFENSIRSLSGMNAMISMFYKQGCVTVGSINGYIGQLVEREKRIKKILETAASSRMVTQSDRDAYALWTDWGFDDEAILVAASFAQGKPQATGYITKLLTRCKEAKAFTAEEVRKTLSSSVCSNQKSAEPGKLERRYTKEEIGSLFGDLQNYDDIEI